MRFYLNKRASSESGFEISTKQIMELPKIFFLIAFILVVTTPLGCYSKNKEAQLNLVKENEVNLILMEIKDCLEKEISEQNMNTCITRKNIGFTVSSDEISFVVNPENYDKERCLLTKQYICRQIPDIFFIKSNNEIKKVTIDLVIFNE